MLPDQAGSRGHGHTLHQGHDQGLEQQGEARAFPGPGHWHLLHPVLIALAPWHSGRQISRVLKEVQMAPGLLLGVMHLGGLAAGRARKGGTPLEIHEDVQAPFIGVEV